MDESEYDLKALALLNDEQTYKKLKSDPTNKYAAKLSSTLKSIHDEGGLDFVTYRRLLPTSKEIPKFYGTPKIHKDDIPLRPIVSCIGCPAYAASKYISDIIKPLAGKSEHHLKNSQDLINKLANVIVEPDEIMVSYDVSSLYTNVPIEEAIGIIQQRLDGDQTLSSRTSMTITHIINLMKCVASTTYFVYKGQFYLQKQGAAMGYPPSSPTADIFMEVFEDKALGEFHTLLVFGSDLLTTPL